MAEVLVPFVIHLFQSRKTHEKKNGLDTTGSICFGGV
jgi:hypothetical protein